MFTSGVTKSIRELLDAGNQIDRNNLTKVGRALQKHGGREGSVFPAVAGKDLNKEGSSILEGILGSKNQRVVDLENGGQKIFDLDSGRGAAFTNKGDFNGFREVQYEKFD